MRPSEYRPPPTVPLRRTEAVSNTPPASLPTPTPQNEPQTQDTSADGTGPGPAPTAPGRGSRRGGEVRSLQRTSVPQTHCRCDCAGKASSAIGKIRSVAGRGTPSIGQYG